jgi:hypothetical protein
MSGERWLSMPIRMLLKLELIIPEFDVQSVIYVEHSWMAAKLIRKYGNSNIVSYGWIEDPDWEYPVLNPAHLKGRFQ